MNSNVDDKKIEEVVEEFNPEIIGVSFTTGSKRNAFNLVKKFPERFFIAGGFHPGVRLKSA
jgi:Tat protein secretion system quality control protein TatD with DNase activity